MNPEENCPTFLLRENMACVLAIHHRGYCVLAPHEQLKRWVPAGSFVTFKFGGAR